MELKNGSLAFKLACSLICLTFFAQTSAFAQESQFDALQFTLSNLRQNGNPNSTAFVEMIESKIANGELHIIIESSAPKIGAEATEACGWVNPNEGKIDHLHINTNAQCIDEMPMTIIHEYEHIRIYHEEALPTAFNLTSRNVKLGPGDLPQREIDLMLGYTYFGLKMKGQKTEFTEDEKSKFHTFVLFKIYTESKAYLTARNHVGNIILSGATDSEIINILSRYYVGELLPRNIVSQAATQAISARNYEDYIQKTLSLRTSEAISQNLNMSAPAN